MNTPYSAMRSRSASETELPLAELLRAKALDGALGRILRAAKRMPRVTARKEAMPILIHHVMTLALELKCLPRAVEAAESLERAG